MNGKEAIIEAILSDARTKANSTLEEAGKRGDEILSVAENDARIYREKNMSESYAEREEIVRRRITVGNLEVKKTILATKQEIVAEAFSKAIDEIRADVRGYLALLSGMLENAEDGDVVTFAEADRSLVGEKWLKGKADESKKKLAFGGYGDFAGGIVLSGNGSDKNLSLEVELASVKEKFEPEIAGILFGA